MPNPGDPVGDFKLIREIGRGAVGVVFEAHQASLGRTVAVKFLTGDGGGDPTWKERFLSEAGKAAQLSHPGILPIYALGELDDGQPWFAMELVKGRDLADVLKDDGPLEPRRAAEIIRDAARALHHAHENGIVHRDVKPANLMLRDDGRVVVTDFGLSKQLGSGAMTTTGLLVGTPYYMSPEAVSGERDAVGPLADVYGLGVTLYELLIGRRPFDAETPIALIKKIVDEDPAPPRQVLPALPGDLDTIVMASMAKDPLRRPPSADALADELGHFLSGEAIETQPVTVRERLARTVSKNKLAFGIGAGALVLIALAIWIFTGLLTQKDDELEAKEGELAELDAVLDDMRSELADADSIKAGLEGDPAEQEAARAKFAEIVQKLVGRLSGVKGHLPALNGERWASDATATLTVRTVPAGATLEVIGFPDRPAFETLTAPWTNEEVPAGLYRIIATAEGRNTTVATVVLPPGTSADVELTLPEADSRTLNMTWYAGIWAVPARPEGTEEAVRFDKLDPYFMDRRPEAERGRPAMVSETRAREIAGARKKRLPTERELQNALILAPLASLTKGAPAKPGRGEIDAVLAHEGLENGLLPVWGTDFRGRVAPLSLGERKPLGRGRGRAGVRLVLDP